MNDGLGPQRGATEAAAAQRIKQLEDRVAALTEAVADRERQTATQAVGYQAAYADRVGFLEQHVAVLTQAVAERELQARTHLAAHQAASAERVSFLEQHIAELTEAVNARERELQQRQETDYQLMMVQQSLLAEFKDLDPAFFDLYERCKAFTMTSVERLYTLYQSVEYLCAAGIAGDFAECGVWRGGSCMMMALSLLGQRSTDRRIMLFDTFAGHPEPDPERDIDLWGNRLHDEWQRHQADGTGGEWGFAALSEAQANMASTGYPQDRICFIKGMVETTAPENVPDALALLRLDTDWYQSTKAALQHLYPRLASGGVLILDDYGVCLGHRQAVDEYFSEMGQRPLLYRIDYTCRAAIKP